MSNEKKGILDDHKTAISVDELNSHEALDITQQLVKEFIDTKQRMLTDDRKLNAIGKALIRQKQMLDDILDAQDTRGQELTYSLGDISNRQENLSKGVFDIANSMIGIEEAQEEQDKLVQNLNQFQERHDELVHKSTEQSNQSIERLESISEQITRLFTQVEDVDIENRVVEIADRTAEINELMTKHAQKQETAREDASNKMLDLLAEVTSFRQDLSDKGLTGKLEKVQTVSDENNKMIDNLNEKFDMFVEIYEISKVDSIDGLEDIFSDSSDDTIDDYVEDIEEVSFGSDDVEKDTFVDTYDEEKESLEELESIEDINEETLEEDYCDEKNHCDEVVDPDPKLSVRTIDESEEGGEEDVEEDVDEQIELGNDMEIDEFKRIEKEKDSMDTTTNEGKKGFFSKLFGGR